MCIWVKCGFVIGLQVLDVELVIREQTAPCMRVRRRSASRPAAKSCTSAATDILSETTCQTKFIAALGAANHGTGG